MNEACVPKPLLLLTAAFLAGVAWPAYAAGKRQLPTIKILEATYGGNCQNVPKGNVTRFVASECNDKSMCNYRIYYKNMDGDRPASCERIFPCAMPAEDFSSDARWRRRPAGAATRAIPIDSARCIANDP